MSDALMCQFGRQHNSSELGFFKMMVRKFLIKAE